jgi:hypothetical protein
MESGFLQKELTFFEIWQSEKRINFSNISETNHKTEALIRALGDTRSRLTIWKELPQTDRHCHTPAEKTRAAAAATCVGGRTAAYRGG